MFFCQISPLLLAKERKARKGKGMLRRRGNHQLLNGMTVKQERKLMKATWSHKKWTTILPQALMKRNREYAESCPYVNNEALNVIHA